MVGYAVLPTTWVKSASGVPRKIVHQLTTDVTYIAAVQELADHGSLHRMIFKASLSIFRSPYSRRCAHMPQHPTAYDAANGSQHTPVYRRVRESGRAEAGQTAWCRVPADAQAMRHRGAGSVRIRQGQARAWPSPMRALIPVVATTVIVCTIMVLTGKHSDAGRFRAVMYPTA